MSYNTPIDFITDEDFDKARGMLKASKDKEALISAVDEDDDNSLQYAIPMEVTVREVNSRESENKRKTSPEVDKIRFETMQEQPCAKKQETSDWEAMLDQQFSRLKQDVFAALRNLEREQVSGQEQMPLLEDIDTLQQQLQQVKGNLKNESVRCDFEEKSEKSLHQSVQTLSEQLKSFGHCRYSLKNSGETLASEAQMDAPSQAMTKTGENMRVISFKNGQSHPLELRLAPLSLVPETEKSEQVTCQDRWKQEPRTPNESPECPHEAVKNKDLSKFEAVMKEHTMQLRNLELAHTNKAAHYVVIVLAVLQTVFFLTSFCRD